MYASCTGLVSPPALLHVLQVFELPCPFNIFRITLYP